jgi:DNA-binding XRE family transcriptional regulator
MRNLFLPYDRVFDEETSKWCLTGHDSAGQEFGVAVASDPELADERLRDWVLESLLAAAGDGEDRLGDLCDECAEGRQCLTFGPQDLLPIRIRLLRAKHGLRQSDVADRLGISQQAYAKLERPGVNPELETLVRVERALKGSLLEYAS